MYTVLFCVKQGAAVMVIYFQLSLRNKTVIINIGNVTWNLLKRNYIIVSEAFTMATPLKGEIVEK
jgi:hypothetical protein